MYINNAKVSKSYPEKDPKVFYYIDCVLHSFLCLFVLMKSYRKKKTKNKKKQTDLRTSPILLLNL